MQKLIVVTGANSGIGKEVAKKFVAHKNKVLMIARNENNILKAICDIKKEVPDADLDYVATDISKPENIADIILKIKSFNKKIDGIICCAGSAPPPNNGTLEERFEEWNYSYEANILTAILVLEGLEFLISENGSVILFSSIAAYRGSGGSGAYGAMKAALHSYCYTLAARLGVKGINVNVIAPGYISETHFFNGLLSEEREALLIQQTMLGRPGKPNDCAGLCLYLCSKEGEYITSQIIQINGGSSHGV